MYVGYLCSTQIDGYIQTDGEAITPDSPRLVGVFHGGTRQGSGEQRKRNRYETVRLILMHRHTHRIYTEDLDPRHVVTVDAPD
jgi:hypothetical protein